MRCAHIVIFLCKDSCRHKSLGGLVTFGCKPIRIPAPTTFMIQFPDQPKDSRMRRIRKKIGTITKRLRKMRRFIDGLPEDLQTEVQRQLQAAFEAGQAFSEIDALPQTLPVDVDGELRIGPALRFHIMQTRKVYRDVDELRSIVQKIFDDASQKRLTEIMREQEERSSGTDVTNITIEGYDPSAGIRYI